MNECYDSIPVGDDEITDCYLDYHDCQDDLGHDGDHMCYACGVTW